MKWIFSAAVLLSACAQERGGGYNRFLQRCNQVEIVLFNGGDTLYFNTKDTTGVTLLKNQITGNASQKKAACNALGFLRFRTDSTLLLQAQFGVDDQNCRFIAYTYDGYNYVHPISDRAANLLQTVVKEATK